jgi:hypothetical protein
MGMPSNEVEDSEYIPMLELRDPSYRAFEFICDQFWQGGRGDRGFSCFTICLLPSAFCLTALVRILELMTAPSTALEPTIASTD